MKNGIKMPKRGIHCAPEDRLEVRLDAPRGEDGRTCPYGFYIFVRRNYRTWRPLLIRFLRRRDAGLARKALLGEGLSTFVKLSQAGSRVHQIIGEAMQW